MTATVMRFGLAGRSPDVLPPVDDVPLLAGAHAASKEQAATRKSNERRTITGGLLVQD